MGPVEGIFGRQKIIFMFYCMYIDINFDASHMDEIVILPLYRFEEQEAPGSRSFFTEIIASISDIKFGKGGRYILSRDYMTLKV